MPTLRCSETGERYEPAADLWQSGSGAPLDLEFEPRFDPDRLKSGAPTLWRYREAIPINDDGCIVTLGEGFTPLIEAELGGRRVRLKLDQLMPSGSFKDRGASVLLSHALELGVRRVVEDSSGNAGASTAAYAARAGIEAELFVPATASPAKLSQIELYGARLRRVDGTREETAAACQRAADSAYYASHVWQPWFMHGTKTFVYEVVEQLGWRAPDAIVVPVGNGTLLLGCYLGLTELAAAGLIDRMPRLIGVQAAACAPLYQAWKSGADSAVAVDSRSTQAEGIAIAAPARGKQCLHAIRATAGEIIVVSEHALTAALRAATGLGLLIEPTAAVALAGASEFELPGATVVAITGHGLKAIGALKSLARKHAPPSRGDAGVERPV